MNKEMFHRVESSNEEMRNKSQRAIYLKTQHQREISKNQSQVELLKNLLQPKNMNNFFLKASQEEDYCEVTSLLKFYFMDNKT